MNPHMIIIKGAEGYIVRTTMGDLGRKRRVVVKKAADAMAEVLRFLDEPAPSKKGEA